MKKKHIKRFLWLGSDMTLDFVRICSWNWGLKIIWVGKFWNNFWSLYSFFSNYRNFLIIFYKTSAVLGRFDQKKKLNLFLFYQYVWSWKFPAHFKLQEIITKLYKNLINFSQNPRKGNPFFPFIFCIIVKFNLKNNIKFHILQQFVKEFSEIKKNKCRLDSCNSWKIYIS